MTTPSPLYVLPGLLATGIAIQWVASRIRVPAIVLLLAAGVVAGPVTGLLDPDLLLGELLEPVVALAVGLVLFEGGLSLRLVEAKQLGRPLLCLVFGGLVATFALGAAAAHWLAGLSWATSSVLAAVLVVTGPTVIKPMLRFSRLKRRPAQLLKWESIVNDPLGALLAVVALEVAVQATPDAALGGSLGYIPLFLLVAGAIGAGSAWGLGRSMDRGWIPEHLKVPVVFAGVLTVFAVGEALFHEAGLLAVTVMGVVLANVSSPSVESIRHFKEDVATILVSLLFLVLSARLSMQHVEALTLGAVLFTLAVLFVIRPLAVQLAMAPARVERNEKLLIGWIAPRGVVAAAMGGALEPRLLEAGYADAALLVPILFLVIIVTVALHGLTIGPLSWRLGVAARGEGGLLIVGAASWVVDLARALKSAGAEVVIASDDFRGVTRARLEGIEAYFGDVLSQDTLDDLPLERVGCVLAATDDENYNSLVSVALSKLFGREKIFQVTATEDSAGKTEGHLQGRMPWGEEGRSSRFATRYWRDRRFKTSVLTDDYTWDDFQAQWEEATPVFELVDGRIEPLEPDEKPEKGARFVFQP